MHQPLIADQRNFKAKYLQNGEENWTHFSSFNITSSLICTDLISSLLDPKLVDPVSTLVHTALRD